MSRFRYTRDMLAFLRDGYRHFQVPELTAVFNQAFGVKKTEDQIKSTLKNHGFTSDRQPGNPKGTFRLFTQEQAGFIRAMYRAHPLAELHHLVNEEFGTDFTERQLRAFTKNHRVKSGRTGQFEPGQPSHNSGVKGWDAGGRSHETRFKKGNMTGAAQHNYRPIGSTRLTKDGYLERKVNDDHPTPARRWVGEHRLVWEAANGPIPEGHVVVFLDGDKLNIELDNLRCVPRGVLQYLNKSGLNKTSGEARKSAILTAEVVTRIHQRARA